MDNLEDLNSVSGRDDNFELDSDQESYETIDKLDTNSDRDEHMSEFINDDLSRSNRYAKSQGRAKSNLTAYDVRNIDEIFRRRIEEYESMKRKETVRNPYADKQREILINSSSKNNFGNANSRSFQTKKLRGGDVAALKVIVDVIPAFSGTNISVQAFTRECKFAEEQISPHLHPLLLKLLKTKITGEAERYIKNFKIETLKSLLACLERVFGAPKTIFQVQSEISQLRQNTDETVLSYSGRAMDLFSKMVELTENQSTSTIAALKIEEYDAEVASCFCRGLKPGIESRVLQKNPKTLETAINHAIEAEREIKRRKRLHGEDEDLKEKLTGDREIPRKIFKPVNSVTTENNSDGKIRTNAFKSKNCYTCGELGHISRGCPKGRHNNDRKNGNSRYQGGSECDYCNRKGHLSSSCLLKRLDDSERRVEELLKMSSLNSQGAHRQTGTMSRSNIPSSVSTKNNC